MKIISTTLALGVLAALGAAPIASLAGPGDDGDQRAVFVMTNDADSNQIVAYKRTREGTLFGPVSHSTGGRGAGGIKDPLQSQGSLTLSEDRSVLFAANAGSGTVSVFRVFGSNLVLTDVVPTGGSEPNAIAQHGNLVYVLNSAASSSVVGFRLHEGKLVRLPDSLRFLSGNVVAAASIAFSADGRYLVATEFATNKLDVFKVLSDGRLSDVTVNTSVGPGAFSVAFARDTVIVAETGPGTPNASAMSTYSISPNNTLVPITASIPTLGTLNCWNVITPDGRFVYASNSGSSSIAGFRIGGDGTLTPIPGTIVGLNPAGSANLDITISSDGAFLYSLNEAKGTIGVFGIRRSDGTLTNLGTVGGLPPGVGLQGIAAN
jgi:6-phosphogluconolactonase